jgi:hypothetical protein
VFDLFNFPRMPMAQEGVETAAASNMGQAAPADLGAVGVGMAPNFTVPNPEADWLFHTT